MKQLLILCLIAGVPGTGTGVDEVKVLEKSWFLKMDADNDGKVSRAEYIKVGANYLKEQGRPVNRQRLDEKFNGFDRNRDGFITDEDPESGDPVERFLKAVQGRWTIGKNALGLESITFLEQGKADIVRSGKSLRDQSRGLLTYGVEYPDRVPVCMEIRIAAGTTEELRVKCIFSFLSDNQLKIRAFVGDSETPFPDGFLENDDDPDTFLLTRIQKPAEPEPKKKPLTFFGIPVL